MRVSLAAIGRMKAGPERELVDRYLQRFGATGGPVGLDYAGLSEFPESRGAQAEMRKREEAARLAATLPEGAASIVLDERGRTLSSEEFARAIADLRDGGRRGLGILIGGPDGHDPALRQRADLVLALGRMTFPHQIARILLAEQLYRAVTILSGHPYHRV
ncbi:23S rRNA (pseudouridine(1915)-N(3))-methyltransferase RlmH [Aurantimonas sp. Leaf443]|uniref:23S rRNA (pseudouridine(1915)-N(3))-methyltransferase RlmH n=1 Tax=Aurantimonas sp. Leaf443 TaxID=1736378 RepID=UPI0006FE1BC8|nr:23S rRNA (pseudouridine(1915)-N(3))-methyltransferase RlmH [Aurantimonas sp. Leaf443]KQT87505.1 50S rRNA methyltransferase [Aurantimonas sp. Leaf443]